MAEVGKTDHTLAADTQHLPDQGCRIVYLLKGLGQDHEIEGIVRIIPDLFVDVPLQTVNPRSMQWATQCLVDVDTGADRIFTGFQIVEQRTVSASQPQYPGPCGIQDATSRRS
jgi:hypothetical protein